jgi:hypothetical protein
MSLISLQSKQNQGQPYLFNTHFPQPIELKPYSQVCVLKFLHFRNTTSYIINSTNNTLRFLLGDTRFDALRNVVLDEGEYSGDQLALELEKKMNDTKQQFNYDFDVVFTKGDSTLSPPTEDSFVISYQSVLIPSDPYPGEYKASLTSNVISGTGYAGVGLADYDNTSVDDSNNKLVSTRGVITSLGQYILEGVAYDKRSWDSVAKDILAGSFSEYSFGVVEDALSKIDTDNENLKFTYRHGTAGVRLSRGGFHFFMVNRGVGKKLGDPDYVSLRLCREIPDVSIAEVDSDKSVSARRKFKFVFTMIADGDTASGVTRQEGHKIICQVLKSDNYGSTYTEVQTGDFGNDSKGNDFVKNLTIGGVAYNGVVWMSDDPELNDESSVGVSLALPNILQTKRAPFKTFIEKWTPSSDTPVKGDFLEFDLSSPTTWNGGTLVAYSGTHTSVYDYTLSDGVDTGYLSKGDDPLTWNVSSTDSDLPTLNGAVALDLTTNPLQVTWTKGDLSTSILLVNTGTLTSKGAPFKTKIGALFNSAENPVSISLQGSDDDIKTHKVFYDDKNATFGLTGKPSGTLVGVDLSKQCSLLVSTLSDSDRKTYEGSPLFLTKGTSSGSIGASLGAQDDLFVGTKSTGQDVFTSQTKPKKTSKDTTLHISIPELSGVKSYEGGFNSVSKSIAIVPKEEIVQMGDNDTLTYISPFQNWIDINNANMLKLNSFTTEIRLNDGSLADTLEEVTTLQIKFREDPEKRQERTTAREIQKLGEQMLKMSVINTGS